MFEQLINVIKDIGGFFDNTLSILTSVGSFIISLLGFIWYAGKTLIVGVYKLLVYIFEGGVFINVNHAFIQISDYIGGPATIFISALLFIIIVRIIVAFVFKMLRINIDYHALNSKSKRWNQHDTMEKTSVDDIVNKL